MGLIGKIGSGHLGRVDVTIVMPGSSSARGGRPEGATQTAAQSTTGRLDVAPVQSHLTRRREPVAPMTRFRLRAASVVAGPLLAVLAVGCAPPLEGVEPPARKHSEGALAITGTWVCRDSRSFPVDWGWGGATACTLSVRKLSPSEKREHMGSPQGPADPPEGVFYPDETDVDVRLWLSNGKKQWAAPDSTPGWIGPDGCVRLGPAGSCLAFTPSLRKDGKLVLKYTDMTFTFDRQEPTSAKVPRYRPARASTSTMLGVPSTRKCPTLGS